VKVTDESRRAKDTERQRRWRAENAEKHAQTRRAYEAEHREEINARNRGYSQTEPYRARNRAKARERYHANPEGVRAKNLSYYQEHKVEILAVLALRRAYVKLTRRVCPHVEPCYGALVAKTPLKGAAMAIGKWDRALKLWIIVLADGTVLERKKGVRW
jgi:hypothetical protein